jgi:hypothetical protein
VLGVCSSNEANRSEVVGLDFRRFEIARDLLDKTHHVALRLIARAMECELLVLAVLLHELEISRNWPEQMLLAIPRWAQRAADLVGTERYLGLEAGIAASLSDAFKSMARQMNAIASGRNERRCTTPTGASGTSPIEATGLSCTNYIRSRHWNKDPESARRKFVIAILPC